MGKSNTTEAKASLPIRDRIKSFQDALDYNGETLEQFEHRTQFDTPGQKAGKQLEVIALALNEGTPRSRTDRWYYPWFDRVSSGVGLSYYDYVFGLEYASVGSRLCVNSRENAIHFGKEFIELWSLYIYGK